MQPTTRPTARRARRRAAGGAALAFVAAVHPPATAEEIHGQAAPHPRRRDRRDHRRRARDRPRDRGGAAAPGHEGGDRRRRHRGGPPDRLELGPSTVALPLDVTDRASFAAFLDGAEEQLGPLDVLVNNAGIMQIGRFIDEDDLTARRMVDINIHGVILGMKLALERMIPRDRGHIVNISSQAGKFGAPGGATYSATKHAVVGLTEAVRGELRLMGAHIDLSYVMPFVVNTELGSGLGEARGLQNLEPTTSPTRSSRRCSSAPSKCGCRSPPSARTCSARCCRGACPRAWPAR